MNNPFRYIPKGSAKIDRAPRLARKPRSRSTDSVSFHAQARMMRLMEVIMLLSAGHHSIAELAEIMGQSPRTIYRYTALLESLGFGLEVDFHGKYFLVENTCPLCGGALHHG